MAFLEDYTLLEELGQGAFATVYKVRHNELGYIRAIRVLNATIAQGKSDPTYQKFLEECKLLLRLGNGCPSNIVRIFQPLLLESRAVVEMDYIEGEDLYKFVESRGNFIEITEIMSFVKDIVCALSYCHVDIYEYCMDRDLDKLRTDPNDGSKVLIDEETRQRLIQKYQVIHNDLHPGNIMRKRSGEYVLLDFGLAIEGNSVVRSSRRKNGVPEYKSPEKWRNELHISTQSDIYSFGVILYYLLAGRPPFMLDTENPNSFEAEHSLYNAHMNELPPAIYTYRKEAFERAYPGQTYEKDYPDWLETLILKCLEKLIEDRFQDGKELLDFVNVHIGESTLISPTIVDNRKCSNRSVIFNSNQKRFEVKGVSFNMIKVEGGTFMMGNIKEKDQGFFSRLFAPTIDPPHQVQLSDYYIGETQVTQEMWQAVMGDNPSQFKGNPLCPVERVSWNDCQKFINKLNEITGQTFRLPTEAEWEYAARGGKESNGYEYSGSNSLPDVAWFYDNSNGKTHPVKQKLPNELGLYDMSGNVFEWCFDWFDGYYYRNSPNLNPNGPKWGIFHVYRGGSWKHLARYCRVANRGSLFAVNRSGDLGLRLAL